MDGDGVMRVLMVCTGNICRSPAAERLARHWWGHDDQGFVITSAGVGALVGEPINLTMVHELLLDGVDTSRFQARQIDASDVGRADLVLGLTARHRRVLVDLAPAATKRTFTLREFARLIDSAPDLDSNDPAARLRSLVDHASRNRTPTEPGHDDVKDPYGRSTEDYAVAYAQIKEAVRSVARLLRPA